MSKFANGTSPLTPGRPAEQQAPALSIKGLRHRYGDDQARTSTLALDGVELEVGAGEFLSLVGPSGCGKSTLLRAAAGLLRASAGEVRVLGGTPAAARAARALGLVTQEPGLLPWRTVAGNVALTLEVTGGGGRRQRAERVDALLRSVGIERFAAHHPHELSGGMRQRVALARALAHRPRLLLMDEPFGALDELSREELRHELLRLCEPASDGDYGTGERGGMSVLFVTHSIREAVLLSDRVLVMTPAPGRIAAEVPIALPRPRSAALEESEEFANRVRRVRAALETRTEAATW